MAWEGGGGRWGKEMQREKKKEGERKDKSEAYIAAGQGAKDCSQQLVHPLPPTQRVARSKRPSLLWFSKIYPCQNGFAQHRNASGKGVSEQDSSNGVAGGPVKSRPATHPGPGVPLCIPVSFPAKQCHPSTTAVHSCPLGETASLQHLKTALLPGK